MLKQIHDSYYEPGKLYRMTFSHPLYTEKDLHNVYKRTKPGDIVLILGTFVLQGHIDVLLKLVYNTHVLYLYHYYETKLNMNKLY